MFSYWPSQPWIPLYRKLLVSQEIFFEPNTKLMHSPFREAHSLYKPYPGGSYIIRQSLIERGVPVSSLDLLMASLAQNTLSLYNSSLKFWLEFDQQKTLQFLD